MSRIKSFLKSYGYQNVQSYIFLDVFSESLEKVLEFPEFSLAVWREEKHSTAPNPIVATRRCLTFS